jgi:bifunctional DNA primase/polymerase-like protein
MPQPQNNLTDYLAVATEWHRRGFFTTPVKPMAKHPRFNDWTKHPAKNLSTATQNAYDYPNDDVGLVSTRGAGHFFWLDIDHKSVEDRIFRDTGHRLPRTLTTLSRPKTAPWKKHLCFRQTAYSVSMWRTEMTGIRDFTMPKDADGKVPNLFDVKGVGGGGFVVAAGCCRQTVTSDGIVEEMYTMEDGDAPVIDVPDWLVKWVIEQYRKFRSEDAIRRATEADFNRIVSSALTKAETERRVVVFEYDPTFRKAITTVSSSKRTP